MNLHLPLVVVLPGYNYAETLHLQQLLFFFDLVESTLITCICVQSKYSSLSFVYSVIRDLFHKALEICKLETTTFLLEIWKILQFTT